MSVLRTVSSRRDFRLEAGRSLCGLVRNVRRHALCEFAKHIAADSAGEPNCGVAEDQAHAPIRARVIQIGQSRGTDVAKQIGIVRWLE